jgi:hypothetical protein
MTQAKEKILVVVDGYSSGSQLPTLMAESGWKCIHVSSSPNPPEYYLRTYHKDGVFHQWRQRPWQACDHRDLARRQAAGTGRWLDL